MRRKLIIVVVLFFSALLLIGGITGYYYLLRVEDKCTHLDLDDIHVCYTMNLFGLIPIANIEYTVDSALKDGSRKNFMLLKPIGVAVKILDNVRLEATSVFDSETHLPVSFSIMSYEPTGLRSTKSSTYDFDSNVLRWRKFYPSTSKEPKSEINHLNSNTFSPLSAIHHLLSLALSDDFKIDIQVKKGVYFLSSSAPVERRAADSDDSAGKLKQVSLFLSKHKGQEPWRRRKDLSMKLLFSQDKSSTAEGFFPLKATLPFHLLTLKRAPGKTL